MAGTPVAIGRDPMAGFDIAAGATPIGAERDGTCIGTEPSPIWTEGDAVGTFVAPKRWAAEDGAIGGGVTGTSTGADSGAAMVGMTAGGEETGNMGSAITPKLSGSGGTAVFATPTGWLGCAIGSGGGVGGKASGGGATTGFGAGAAPWSFAPQLRQNL